MSDVDPAALIDRVASAYLDSRCLHVAAALGVADRLGDEDQSVADLAEAVGCDELALGRILRHLASLGIFAMANGRFCHNDASRLLRSDAPENILPIVRLVGLPVLWASD